MRKRLFSLFPALVAIAAIGGLPIAFGWPEDDEPIGPDPHVGVHNYETVDANQSDIKVWGHVHNHGNFDDQLYVNLNSSSVSPTIGTTYNQPWAETWDVEYTVDLTGLNLQSNDELKWLCETLNYDDWLTYHDSGTTTVD